MIVLKVTQTADGLAILLTEEAERLLGVGAGGEISLDVANSGDVTLAPMDMSPHTRRERGRAFILRYKDTFEALAK